MNSWEKEQIMHKHAYEMKSHLVYFSKRAITNLRENFPFRFRISVSYDVLKFVIFLLVRRGDAEKSLQRSNWHFAGCWEPSDFKENGHPIIGDWINSVISGQSQQDL